FPVAKRFRHRVMWWDWLLACVGVATTVYLIAGGDEFFDRSIVPNDWDIVFGVALVLLILEAMRRTTGWILPFVTTCFLLYAFFIAEFLKISYLDVVLMATIPTCLYYLALFIMVEIDVRKFGMKDVLFEQIESAWSLTKKYWFHFLSLISIVAFMLLGFSPELSVFWATVVAFVTSFLHRDCALISYDLLRGREPLLRGFVGSGF